MIAPLAGGSVAEQKIRFDDGAAYERMMGIWSGYAGEIFLDWLAPRPGLRWIDIGCGNGAFTELIVARAAPAAVAGVDPSQGQLSYARQRHKAGLAEFKQGDAMALPFADRSFDAATMADSGRAARHRHSAHDPAERRRLAHGSVAGFMARRRP